MKTLVEMIGKRNDISVIDIHNQYESIDNNIKKLVEAEVKLSTDEIIMVAIKWCLSLKLRMEYKTIFNYITETRVLY